MVIWFSNFILFLMTISTDCTNDAQYRTEDRRLLLNDPNTILDHIASLEKEIASLKSQVNTQATQLRSQRTQIDSLQNQLSRRNTEGSVYTVWGRKSCPAVNGTTTVYTGIAGGNGFNDLGGGVDTLCLPHDPDDASHDFPTQLEAAGYISHLYGTEYTFTYRKFAQDDDVPCAVCHVGTANSVLMIAAKSSCPSGWTMQYNGYLVSNSHGSGRQPSDYVCIHNDSEYLTEGARQHNMNGHLFYPVQAICGSLPCPPYRNRQYITCVLCTV